jgi:lipoprotein-anchoring transpeptidase ErfK/SrfK
MKKVIIAILSFSIFWYSCSNNTNGKDGTGTDTTNQHAGLNDTSRNEPDTGMLAAPVFSIIIDTSDKQLRVIKGTDTVKTYPISVGTTKYPTPVGDFRIHQIDFNPNWTPPEGDWAKNKKPEKPGSKKNPMGRARIVYQMPYTIHGTKDLNSLGEAESHGSVRMANNDVIELARLIMQETGTIKPESWYQEVLADSTKMISVDLKRTVSLTNRQ